jgi:hypothetical protein
MNSISSGFRILGVAVVVLVFGALQIAAAQVQPAAQAQAAAPVAGAAQSTFCGSQPLCYETADFAATITDFRTSTSGGLRLIDLGMRFQNKTNQPLILGYLVNSGTALDDRGNRYGVWGANGFRGIGAAYGGTNFDPKFNIRAGSYSDAQFELAWAPGQTPYGLTFELNLSVDEINSIEAGQHTLGGEFPLHYRGLVNGVSSAAPGQATAFNPSSSLPPCSSTGTAVAGAANSAGGQTTAGANTAVSNAAAAISNFGSLFGKKKAAAPAAPNAGTTTTAASVPCAPAANGSSLASGSSMNGGTSTGTSMSAVNTTGTQTTNGTSATATPIATQRTATTTATQKTATMTATQKAATTPTAKPVLTNAAKVTPVPPANAAVKKTATPPPPAKPVSQ